MKVIGLTGGVGTGKSTVAGMFRELGAAVLDADAYVHGLLGPGSEVTRVIAERFGNAVLTPDGAVNRALLAEQVFSNSAERSWLEGVIHPRVLGMMQEDVEVLRSQDKHAAVVLEIPLLYEAGADSICDFVIVVAAPEEVQFRRLKDKRNWSPSEIKNRMAAQWHLSAKEEKADAVIDNGRSLERTSEQVKNLWHKHIKK